MMNDELHMNDTFYTDGSTDWLTVFCICRDLDDDLDTYDDIEALPPPPPPPPTQSQGSSDHHLCASLCET